MLRLSLCCEPRKPKTKAIVLGKVIMFLAKCPREVPEVKKMALHLINKWIRPILNQSMNYKDLQRSGEPISDISAASYHARRRDEVDSAGDGKYKKLTNKIKQLKTKK